MRRTHQGQEPLDEVVVLDAGRPLQAGVGVHAKGLGLRQGGGDVVHGKAAGEQEGVVELEPVDQGPVEHRAGPAHGLLLIGVEQKAADRAPVGGDFRIRGRRPDPDRLEHPAAGARGQLPAVVGRFRTVQLDIAQTALVRFPQPAAFLR